MRNNKLHIITYVVVLITLGAYYGYTAVTGESLINVQNPNYSGVVSGVRVKDAGNIGDRQTAGIVPNGLMVFDNLSSHWHKARGTRGRGLLVDVSGINSTVPVTLGNFTSNVRASQSGTWTNNVKQSNYSTLNGRMYQGGNWVNSVKQSNYTTLNSRVFQGGTWNLNNISGTVSLPTGASTSTLQTTGNLSLSSIDGKITTTVNGIKVDSFMAYSSAMDGHDRTIGRKADTAVTDSTTTNTLMSFLKGLVKIFADIWNDAANAIRVVLTNSTGTEIGTVANPVRVEFASSSFKNVTGTTTTSFINRDFGFTSRSILFTNDGAGTIQISFNNGTTIHGNIKASETLTFDGLAKQRLAVKSAPGGNAFRWWAW